MGVELGVKVTSRTVTPELVREELVAYETKYGITSSEFLRLFYSGAMHQHEVTSWEFYCDMAKELGVKFD